MTNAMVWPNSATANAISYQLAHASAQYGVALGNIEGRALSQNMKSVWEVVTGCELHGVFSLTTVESLYEDTLEIRTPL